MRLAQLPPITMYNIARSTRLLTVTDFCPTRLRWHEPDSSTMLRFGLEGENPERNCISFDLWQALNLTRFLSHETSYLPMATGLRCVESSNLRRALPLPKLVLQ